MESLFFLIPFGLIFIAIAVKVLFWAINSGQYDNLDAEGHRILFDDAELQHKTEQADSAENKKIQSNTQEGEK